MGLRAIKFEAIILWEWCVDLGTNFIKWLSEEEENPKYHCHHANFQANGRINNFQGSSYLSSGLERWENPYMSLERNLLLNGGVCKKLFGSLTRSIKGWKNPLSCAPICTKNGKKWDNESGCIITSKLKSTIFEIFLQPAGLFGPHSRKELKKTLILETLGQKVQLP